MNCQYEVLNPFAEVDMIPVRGISNRLMDLTDKTIGLFINAKIAAPKIQTIVEKKLKERFPTLKFDHFLFGQNLEVIETGDKERFEKWVKEVDTVITAVGD
ncbi:MAG: hypothetical protein JRJ70_14580 [Deltaproteobacteria bacterium]|nr:hypothetical protein [Deltaproteobacteria bacterium]